MLQLHVLQIMFATQLGKKEGMLLSVGCLVRFPKRVIFRLIFDQSQDHVRLTYLFVHQCLPIFGKYILCLQIAYNLL